MVTWLSEHSREEGDKLDLVSAFGVLGNRTRPEPKARTERLQKGFFRSGVCSSLEHPRHCWPQSSGNQRGGRPRGSKSLMSSASLACFQSLAILIKHILLNPRSSCTEEDSTFCKAEGWGWPAVGMRMKVRDPLYFSTWIRGGSQDLLPSFSSPTALIPLALAASGLFGTFHSEAPLPYSASLMPLSIFVL